jgi:hypothetical protein
MTKTEIAVNLYTQYAQQEEKWFTIMDKVKKCRENGDKEARRYHRNEANMVQECMRTIDACRLSLGISNKQWHDASMKVYITMTQEI